MKRFWVLCAVAVVVGTGLVGLAQARRVLRMTEAWPTYIDPAVGRDLSSSIALVNLYDSLVYPDSEGNPQPHVATRWEVSEDGLIWTFYLRDDVLFHNGDPLTAEDVKFSMDRLLTIGEGYAYLFLDRVEATEVVDPHTVQFRLSKPFGPFLSTLYRLYILNKNQVLAHIKTPGPYGDLGDYGREWLLTHDAGSGPYMVKEFRLEEELVAVKNPAYWIPIDPEAPDEFRFIATTEPATVRTMMARRELEITDTWQPEENLRAMAKIEGVEIRALRTGTPFVYMMHTRKPPTDDVHFRRAMAWAFDYETVREQIFPGALPMIGPVPLSNTGAVAVEEYPHYRDLERAKEELKQSKYYDQLGQYVVEVDWCAEVPDEEKVALLFMSNMAEIGIRVKLVKTPWMTMVEEAADMEAAPHIQTTFVTPAIPEAGIALLGRYHSSSARTYTQNEWLLDSELDAMIEDALRTTDDLKRFAKYAAIQHYIAEICPTINVFEQVRKHAYQAAYVDWPLEKLPEALMGYAYALRFIKVHPEKRAELLGG